ncbi:glutathione S-transferase family protein [Shewanella sp. D64]|uniref:glutathione S-transferase family protein n=1 Tax=unclassified Shewanella TaxID=196818 RepID=UPI0022BA47A7|nr:MULTISPECIES: glutathione S-transferase family protein [unclassified Shewanella]MEC4727550.1 glutathione S-transferase family protein [Shewanella sp. D64]MEC4739801.1 glutathione S-transferase family protein [Shewanella sp. E94]WBJ98055.1 glutathione S-transferase family protein [Shewanella sp. MTB7]
MELYYHPLSRYSQKVLLALYEKQANFFPRVVELSDPLSRQEFSLFYPPAKVPLLKSKQGYLIPESSIIIEYVDNEFPQKGTRLIPPNTSISLDTRLQDRLIDLELSNVLFEFERQQLNPEDTNQIKIKQLEKRIRRFLQYLDNILENNHWLCGDSLTLADCALIPCLPYAREHFQLFKYDNLSRYWAQAQLRGSYQQVQEEIELALTEVLVGRRPIP